MTDEHIRMALLKQRRLFGTQKALAEALGMSEQNLYRFLAGKQGLVGNGGHKLLQALGLEPAMVRILKPEIEL